MTIRCTWHARDNNRVNAATTARSTQDSRGLLTWRRNTPPRGAARGSPHLSSMRCEPAVPARPGPARRSDIAVVAPRPTILPDSHSPAMPQVTAVDDQFGTHTDRAEPIVRPNQWVLDSGVEATPSNVQRSSTLRQRCPGRCAPHAVAYDQPGHRCPDEISRQDEGRPR